MKSVTLFSFLFLSIQGWGQAALVPGKKLVQDKWIRSQQYTLKWYMLRDTSRFEMATVRTQIDANSSQVTVVTEVAMKGMNAPWIDSTIAHRGTLAPIYHSSYNMQRDMRLWFGKVVTGTYVDRMRKKRHEIEDTLGAGYFDSNIYPVLTGWLPLQDGYTASMVIYDCNPEGKTGLLKAYVTRVVSGSYQTRTEGDRAVWIVTAKDEIGGGENGESVYYFDKADRRLWKQEIAAGGRKMEMIRVE